MLPRWFRKSASRTSKKSHRKTKFGAWLNSRRPAGGKPLYLELLEERDLLSTVTWVNPGSGNWNTPANWSTGVPCHRRCRYRHRVDIDRYDPGQRWEVRAPHHRQRILAIAAAP